MTDRELVRSINLTPADRAWAAARLQRAQAIVDMASGAASAVHAGTAAVRAAAASVAQRLRTAFAGQPQG